MIGSEGTCYNMSIFSPSTGCGYDSGAQRYSCGEHGVCKQTELGSLLVLRYCVCNKGYSGKETCDQTCSKYNSRFLE